MIMRILFPIGILLAFMSGTSVLAQGNDIAAYKVKCQEFRYYVDRPRLANFPPSIDQIIEVIMVCGKVKLDEEDYKAHFQLGLP